MRANSFLVPTAEQVRNHAPSPPGASSEAPKGLGAKRPSWCGGFACRPSSPEPTPRRDAAIAEKGQGTDEGAPAQGSFVAALPNDSFAAAAEKPAASGDAHRRGNGGLSFVPCKSVGGTKRGLTSPNPTPPGMGRRRASFSGRRVTPVSEQHYVIKTQLGEYDTFGEEGFLSQSASPVSVRHPPISADLRRAPCRGAPLPSRHPAPSPHAKPEPQPSPSPSLGARGVLPGHDAPHRARLQ